MAKLLRFIKAYKIQAILAPLFKMLEASFELMIPLVVASMIRDGIGQGSAGIPHVWKMGGLLLLLAVVGLVSSVTAQYFSAKAATGFAADMKHALFAHMQRFSFAEIDQMGTSTLITRMTGDANTVQNGVNMVLRLFLRSPFIVIGAMVMAFTIDVPAALIFAVVIPALFVVVMAIVIVTIPMFQKVQKKLDAVLGITRENLSGVRVIRAFTREAEEVQEFDRRSDTLVHFQLFAGRISALMNPLTYVMINLALVALIYRGAIRVDTGHLTQAQVVALVNYMGQILVELIKFANLIITITKSIASGNRIQSVFETEPTLQISGKDQKWDMGKMSPDADLITFDHVGYTYQGAGDATLRDIHFSVKPGETLGIIGGTGSGKTTLVHLLAHFYDATEGEVRIGGIRVQDLDQQDLHRRAAIVMQKAALFRGTIRSNLLWGNPSATDADLMEAIDTAQAAEIVAGKEGGLDAEVEQNGRNFSGGQRQRLSIARALCGSPEILILDDSSSALDYATDAALRKALAQMQKKREAAGHPMTVVVISQRTSSVSGADHILVLDDGAMAGYGTHAELLQTSQVYKEIHESQTQAQGREEAGV